jgi:hypothetical protein
MDIQPFITALCSGSAPGMCTISGAALWGSICTLISVYIATATAIFFTVRWSFQSVLDHRDAEIALLKTGLDSYKDKLNGATPAEARARIDELEAHVERLQDNARARHLTKSQVFTISQALSGTNFSIDIVQDWAARDAENFSSFLFNAFERGGWDPGNPSVTGDFNVPTGLAVVVNNPLIRTEAEELVIRALTAAALRFDIQAIDLGDLEKKDAVILVTARPI